MNKYSLTLLLILPLSQVMSLDAQAVQPATLVIPAALDVVTVDKTKYSKSIFSALDTTLKLQSGKHKMILVSGYLKLFWASVLH